jgi:putative transposase
MKQLPLPLPQIGGRRKGAGRPRTRPHPGLEGPGVPHARRAGFASRYPVHVTQRVQPGVGHLRSQSRSSVILAALRKAKGLRVVHHSIQGNHLHLIVEAPGCEMLALGMQGLSVRIAKGLNRLAGRRGGVFVDRYHSHVLRTPREVANALKYLQHNFRHHTHEWLPEDWRDRLSTSSDAPFFEPRVWLLRVGWQKWPG